MNDMFGYRIDTAMKLTELQRELDRRRSTYANHVKRGYLGAGDARHRIAILQAIIDDYNKKSEPARPQPVERDQPVISSKTAAEALAEIRKTLES